MSQLLATIVDLALEYPSSFLEFLTELKRWENEKVYQRSEYAAIADKYLELYQDLILSAAPPGSDLKIVTSIPLLKELKDCLSDPESYGTLSYANLPKAYEAFLRIWSRELPALAERLDHLLLPLRDIQAQDGIMSTLPTTASIPEATVSAAGSQVSEEEGNTEGRYPILPRKPRETYVPYTRRPLLPANQDTSKIYSSR